MPPLTEILIAVKVSFNPSNVERNIVRQDVEQGLRESAPYVSHVEIVSDIHELFQRVRKHPDYVFGTIFTREDFANRDCDGFPERQAEDAIVSRGSEFIADAGFAMSDEEEN